MTTDDVIEYNFSWFKNIVADVTTGAGKLMKKKLEVFLFDRLSHHLIEDASDDEKYLHLTSLLACTYAASMNFFLMLFHFFTSVWPLFFVSLAGLLSNVLLIDQVNKRHYLPFGILLTGVVIVHVLVSAVYIGTNNFIIVYLLVTLMMQILIPYASFRVRTLMVIALWVSLVALVLINHLMTPIRDIGEANTTLAFFNIHLAFFGTIIQLTVGNTVRSVITKANRKKLEESKNEANTDPLTGLFNRRFAGTFFRKLVTGQLEQLWCVAMLDIDDFKLFNDTNGHRIGDSILMELSDFLKTSLRRGDLVFRWGGEEFLILLKDVDVSTAFLTLEKLRSRLESKDFEIQGKILKLTVTIGVCPLDIDNIEQSIDLSDRLMYQGKALGKNRVVM
ncbi:MAG: GGDEF domain-containing protein [Christensenellales bacterium]